LLLVRRFGYALLGLQLIAFLVWSTVIYNRFALTFDFTMFHQAWLEIAHGHLNPYNTVKGNYFWQDHSEFIMWPIALTYWVWPHPVVLLWLQDVCVVGAEAVAFTWLCELAQRARSGAYAKGLAIVGLFLLVANPWTWWTVSWDFHTETLAMPFAVLLAWDLCNDRRRAWVWIVPLLACGDVAATYVAALGLAALLAGRRWRKRGVILTGIGIAATVLITLVHGNEGSGGGLQAYAYLASTGHTPAKLGLGAMAKGILLHPLRVLRQLWAKRPDIWANTAPSGMPGIGFIWLLPMVVNVLLANNLFDSGWLFAAPGFQSLPLYILLPVGTVVVLAKLTQRHLWIALVLTGIVLAQAVGYSVVWLPRTPTQWLRVSAPAAATLAAVLNRIPASAEVIASQGIVGRFAGRRDVQAMFAPGTMPLRGGDTWFVIAPKQGIEAMQLAAASALIQELAGPLHASLVVHANGVWAFQWRSPPGLHRVTIPSGSGPQAAWPSPGVAGREVLTGPTEGWHVAATGRKGYVIDGLQWLEPAARYQATVTLSADGPVNVEVWNDTGNTLLARRSIPGTNGVQSVSMSVNATTDYHVSVYSGWGPFQVAFLEPPPGQMLEVRVWSPGGETVNVYRAALVRTGG
jgi:hypothetical protein